MAWSPSLTLPNHRHMGDLDKFDDTRNVCIVEFRKNVKKSLKFAADQFRDW